MYWLFLNLVGSSEKEDLPAQITITVTMVTVDSFQEHACTCVYAGTHVLMIGWF